MLQVPIAESPLPPPPRTPQAGIKSKQLDCLVGLQVLHVGISSASLFSSTNWLSCSSWCQDGCCIPDIAAKHLAGEEAHPILGERPQEPPLSSDWPALPTAQPIPGQKNGGGLDQPGSTCWGWGETRMKAAGHRMELTRGINSGSFWAVGRWLNFTLFLLSSFCLNFL